MLPGKEDFELDEDRVTRNEDGSVTWRLYFPIKIKFKGPEGEREEKLEGLTFRRTNAEDMEESERANGDMATNRLMFTRLTGIDGKTFGKLDSLDLMAGAMIIAGFTDVSRLTGDPS